MEIMYQYGSRLSENPNIVALPLSGYYPLRPGLFGRGRDNALSFDIPRFALWFEHKKPARQAQAGASKDIPPELKRLWEHTWLGSADLWLMGRGPIYSSKYPTERSFGDTLSARKLSLRAAVFTRILTTGNYTH